MGRARSKNPKKNQYCLRLTDRQAELLEIYSAFKGYPSNVVAIRSIIDGLEDWLRRQAAKSQAIQAVASHQSQDGASHQSIERPPEAHSGLPSATADTDDYVDTSVGDFAGRPSIALPESRPFDED